MYECNKGGYVAMQSLHESKLEAVKLIPAREVTMAQAALALVPHDIPCVGYVNSKAYE